MATVRSDRKRFLELADICRELQFMARRAGLISLESEGLSASEIRSEIAGLAAGKSV